MSRDPGRAIRIAFFGSSLVSAYWNGAATYYRGIIRALHGRGHRVTFYEPDAFDRQAHRDMEDPQWAQVVVYGASGESAVMAALEAARGADVIVKASGVGVHDALLEREVLNLRRPGNVIVFWDVDAPATLERVARQPEDAFRPLIARYDLILTYGGGDPVISAYRALGARECVPIYNALDPLTHHPVAPEVRFEGLLGFLGNRLPDREERVRQFFFGASAAYPGETFLLGGNGWDASCGAPANVRLLGHLYSRDHNAFNCTPRAILNINRDSMARFGFSPPTRVFEAAGAGACLITDEWPGIESFLEPGREVLVAGNGAEVACHLGELTPQRAARIGRAALQRVLAEHTYAHRAREVERILRAGVRAEAAA
ncbi:MAG TPA: glycosyltransferase [Steroidobacteraceae bacterium]|nr:glycosyltransferase [Steroidobacteraceae bacterium]